MVNEHLHPDQFKKDELQNKNYKENYVCFWLLLSSMLYFFKYLSVKNDHESEFAPSTG